VQHERDPLDGVEGLQDHEQREADRVGEQRPLLGVGGAAALVQGLHRLGGRFEQLHMADAPGAQHVHADPADDGGEPAAQVLDALVVRPAESQPGLLDGFVGVRQRAEHLVGDGPQTAPVLLEAPRQPLAFVHRALPRGCRCSTLDDVPAPVDVRPGPGGFSRPRTPPAPVLTTRSTKM